MAKAKKSTATVSASILGTAATLMGVCSVSDGVVSVTHKKPRSSKMLTSSFSVADTIAFAEGEEGYVIPRGREVVETVVGAIVGSTATHIQIEDEEGVIHNIAFSDLEGGRTVAEEGDAAKPAKAKAKAAPKKKASKKDVEEEEDEEDEEEDEAEEEEEKPTKKGKGKGKAKAPAKKAGKKGGKKAAKKDEEEAEEEDEDEDDWE